jgi:thymidine phosphorylase
MVASILSKKVSAGSTHLLIDLPVGPTAKVRHMREAQRLRKLFEYVAAQLGLHAQVVITDGRQPVGMGIGPVLEARDVCGARRPDAPSDLQRLRLAGRVLGFDPTCAAATAFDRARHPRLRPGAREMNAIIDAGGVATTGCGSAA